MDQIDGLWCYEWHGWLFRVRDGVREMRPHGGFWVEYDPVVLPRTPDDELLHHLTDLAIHGCAG